MRESTGEGANRVGAQKTDVAGDGPDEHLSVPVGAPDVNAGVDLTGNPATDFSIRLLAEFVSLGVRHIVLSPGSRSQALALVAAELERVGALELHVRIDERVGAFLALGLAVESGAPALVVTTSGTAAANLHPAVLEAHHEGVPMILLTADRPVELRGIRSNQTTVQPGLYGAMVRLSEDAAAPIGADDEAGEATRLAGAAWDAALGTGSYDPGPVHLNLAFREPLSAAVPDLRAVAGLRRPGGIGASRSEVGGVSVEILPGPRTVVIAGHGAGEDAERFARAGGWPLLAEISSGARFGPNLVVGYRELLDAAEFGGRVERAIVFGHPTLSREVPALLMRAGVEVVVVAPTGTEFYNPGRRARVVRTVTLAPKVDASSAEAREWVGRWVFASRRLVDEANSTAVDQTAPDLAVAGSHEPASRRAFARDEFAAVRAPVTRRMLADAVWRFTWPHDRLVIGASRLIREADGSVSGKKIRVHANRGLAGIDGTVATAIGIALAVGSAGTGTVSAGTVSTESTDDASPASEQGGVTRVLLGDLALLHDAGALLFGVGERRPAIQVVVGNDGGGTIFDALEVAATASARAMDRVLLTPQRVDLAALAAAYHWGYSLASTRGELDRALSAPIPGPSILEVPLPR